ncbi:MAG: sugar nucleotide-binding protein, partial [Candidatus Tectomicrobia bacterium]|nr:sugar nucleotide-binding protein [Candidatus Tectomicrobia bacterium]
YVMDLARKTVELLQTRHYGLYHITNNGQCSWYEFAQAIFRQAGVQADLHPTTACEFGARARRPAYSVLKNGHLERWGMDDLRDWQEALAAYLKERKG